jgi:hypothetical protein
LDWIFVGSKQLAGEAACRWYINENIPEINAFRSRSGCDLCALFMLLYQDLVLITVYFLAAVLISLDQLFIYLSLK